MGQLAACIANRGRRVGVWKLLGESCYLFLLKWKKILMLFLIQSYNLQTVFCAREIEIPPPPPPPPPPPIHIEGNCVGFFSL